MQFRWTPAVIGIKERNVFSGSFVQPAIPSGPNADPCEGYHTESAILDPHEALAGVIGRGIVDHDALEVGNALGEDARDGLFDILPKVMSRDNDAN